MKHLAGEDTMQVVVFKVANETYSIAVQDVESIIRHSEVTAVPESPSEVRGVIDIRGRLVSIYDLRRRFGLPSLDDETTANVLVLRHDVRDLGLLVDSVSEVATVSLADSQPAPAEATAGNDFLMGVIHHGDELVMLLDVVRLLGGDDAGPAPADAVVSAPPAHSEVAPAPDQSPVPSGV
jgi:purine-binding chemotaxis protein CheW